MSFPSQQLQFKGSHKHFGSIFDDFRIWADLAVYGRNWPNSADISLNHLGHLEMSFPSQQLQFKGSHKHFGAFLTIFEILGRGRKRRFRPIAKKRPTDFFEILHGSSPH